MSGLYYLGEFTFAPATRGDNAHELDRSSEARLAPQDLIGRPPPVQWLGPSAGSAQLHGLILPEYRGGLGQIEAMHAATADGQPRVLVSGYGAYFGLFFIKKVSEKRRFLTPGGLPRKIEFQLDLLQTDEGGETSFFGLF